MNEGKVKSSRLTDSQTAFIFLRTPLPPDRPRVSRSVGKTNGRMCFRCKHDFSSRIPLVEGFPFRWYSSDGVIGKELSANPLNLSVN